MRLFTCVVLFSLAVGCNGKDGGDGDVSGDSGSADGGGDGGGADGLDQDGDGFTSADGDCDDTDPDTHPGAAERCDDTDNDCDGVVDEDIQQTWYTDADGDGHGDAASAVESCDPDPGTVSSNDDCDDGAADVHPGADEYCDDVDQDCDGATDDADAVDAGTWYADADGDGYGNADAVLTACARPEGTAADDTDCDDTDASVNPAAAEVCDGVDQDCDGAVDDGLDEGTWYADADGDGFGDPDAATTNCSQPSGTVDDATDCDDTSADVSPDGSEVCNSIDDDCDGLVDDDDDSVDTSVGGKVYYTDGDGDGYGLKGTGAYYCKKPSGTSRNYKDCDDEDASIHPSADELYDGVDNDCDGDTDEGLWMGDGADGSLAVTSSVDLSEDASGTRTEADAVWYLVDEIDGADITLYDDADGLAANDEVLLINLQGSEDRHDNVGVYEFFRVESVSGDVVTLGAEVSGTYGTTDNSDLSDQVVVLQRVPHYEDVTVGSAGTLTTTSWEDGGTGVVAFRASGELSVADGGEVTVASSGYSGGETGTCNNCDAFQGESYAGEGVGDEYSGTYNQAIYGFLANGGGGGANVTGGGGGYGTAGEDGDAWYPRVYTAPKGGEEYGDADLTALFLGSGGGGVWNGGTDTTGEDPGPGGDGGGVLYIGATTVTIEGESGLVATGADTSHWAAGSWTYGAAGGSGGSLWVIAGTLDVAEGGVDARGGAGEKTHIREGGDGGDGRIRVDASLVNGYTGGSTDAATALEDACEPDPESVGTPE